MADTEARGHDMAFAKAMRTSLTDEWETPQDFFEVLDEEFHFTLDVCATDENHKCRMYFTRECDGLKHVWNGVCWMNPPYGRTIGDWVRKAYLSSVNDGAIVVCLVPARTDTRWWHDYAMKATEIRLVEGRLRFGEAESSAPFPSAVLVFGTPRMPVFSVMKRPGAD